MVDSSRDPPGASHRFAVQHSCFHTVFWSSPIAHLRLRQFACPWCGGASGRSPISISDSDISREVGSLTLPDENGRPVQVYVSATKDLPFPGDKEGQQVIVHHARATADDQNAQKEEVLALRLIDNNPAAAQVAQTCNALCELMMSDERWSGACHALTTIGYVLLRTQGIGVVPCIGEVRVGSLIAFDHSWLELDGAPIDVAIARTLIDGLSLAPVVFGRHIDDARTSDVVYGVKHRGLDPTARRIAAVSFGPYMDGYPDHPKGLWGVAVDVGRNLGLQLDVQQVRADYASARWVLRPQPQDADDDRRRERNRRKKQNRRG